MPNLKSEASNLITICPFCNRRIVIQFPILDVYIYTKVNDLAHFITLKKEFSNNPSNEEYIKSLLINALKRKPFISRVILTKSVHEVINELVITGFLTEKDLKIIEGIL